MDPRPDLVTAYDAHALDRESKGEPDWRDTAKLDLVSRLTPGARLLELGAGVGYTSRWFADRGLTVVATDLSQANVDLCCQKGLDARVADMMDLPFPEGSFDAVWAASCLMHIPNADLPAVLDSVSRLLADGGLFWAGTWGAREGSEGTWEEDWYVPKRFYSIRTDDQIRGAFEAAFRVLSFEVADPGSGDSWHRWHYQMALMAPR